MGSRELLQNCHDLEKMDLEECILVSAPLTALQGALQPRTDRCNRRCWHALVWSLLGPARVSGRGVRSGLFSVIRAEFKIVPSFAKLKKKRNPHFHITSGRKKLACRVMRRLHREESWAPCPTPALCLAPCGGPG